MNQVMVASLDGASEPAEAMCRRLTHAWSGAAAPAFTVASGASLGSGSVEPLDGLVLLADRAADQAAVLTLLATLEEASVPVLAVLDEAPPPGNCYEFAGALIRLQSESDTHLVSALQGLVHRQRDVRRLRQEVLLANRFHGGLRGQFSKMHEELQLAAMVQREFLPRDLPELHGMSFAVLWRPSNYVSGDIYDVARLDEDHVALFIADAIGHGVPAALMTMVICRSLLTKEITDSGYRLIAPEEVLATLNDAMIRRQGTRTRFVTAAYALVNCRTRVMTCAGGGHPAPLVLRSDGSTEPLESRGALLGIFEGERYPQVEVALEPGDRFIMYSDGFEQAFPDLERNGGRPVPSNRYLDEFQALRRVGDPCGMVSEIARRLDDQSGSLHQIDDLTLVCMNVPGQPAAPMADPGRETAEPGARAS